MYENTPEFLYFYLCVCFGHALMHPSASPAIDIQIAPCEKLNQEAVEVLALLFLCSRDAARL